MEDSDAEAPSPNKRQKLTPTEDEPSPGPSGHQPSISGQRHDISEYRTGAVFKVTMHNFMTYNNATIYPGPKLNLVLGPNGTGKSSLVCALCVGLAGSTHLLGRADDVKSFIRRGEHSGWTEIWLASGSSTRPHVKVRRQMKSADNSSEWKLDGKPCTKAAVVAKMQELNVQLDNLCQFLPQDKVVEFARLKPTELLSETEKSLPDRGGSDSLYATHRALIERKAVLNDNRQRVSTLEEEQQRLNRDNEAMERDVARFQQREALLKEVEDLEKKLPWLKFEQQLEEFKELDKNLTAANKTLAEKQAEMEASTGPLRTKKSALNSATDRKTRLDREYKSAWEKGANLYDVELPKKIEAMEKALGAISDLEGAALDLERSLQAQQQKVADLEQQLADLPQPLQGSGDAAAQDKQLDLLRKELLDLQQQRRAFSSDVDDMRMQEQTLGRSLGDMNERLRRMDSVKGRRLQDMEQRTRGIRRVHDFVQAAKREGRFRGQVYGPLMLEVEVANPVHAQMLEHFIPVSVQNFFATEYKEDQDFLIAESKRMGGFRPSISHFGGDATQPIAHRQGDARRFAQFGITHMLDEVFEAPALVKHVLQEESSIGDAFVGTSETQRQVEQLFQHSPSVRSLLTPEASYRVTVSQYNQAARSQQVQNLRQARLLVATGQQGSDERQKLLEEMQEKNLELEEVKGRMAEAMRLIKVREDAIDAARRKQKQLQDERNRAAKERSNLTNKLRVARRMVGNLENAADPRAEEPRLRAELTCLAQKAAELVPKAFALVKEHWEKQKDAVAAALLVKELTTQVRALEAEGEEVGTQVRRWQETVRQAKQLTADAKEAAKRAKREAEASTGPITPELRAQFADLPGTLEEVAALAEDKRNQADLIVCANPRIMDQYRERLARLREVNDRLKHEKELLDLANIEIEQLKERWLPPLHRIVAQIGANFSHSFKGIGCAGEVELVANEDFDKYAIQIKVKFREEEELQVLDSQRQSGGERSVSTILYLVALQQVTTCPFRVVDEINQGMDQYNERKVYLELVKAATEDDTPQCFLLTPKLLPDLPYTSAVTLLNIMNGPRIADVAINFSNALLVGNRPRLVSACA